MAESARLRPALRGRTPKSLSVLDSTGAEIGHLVEDAAARYDLPIALVLGMLKAESELGPFAERYGLRTAEAKRALAMQDWPTYQALILEAASDLSFGMSQITVGTARGYSVGNGESTIANVLNVRQALFNRANAIDLGARHLAGCWARAEGYADRSLQAVLAYNSGSPQPEGNWYWVKYAGTIRRYQQCLQWASEVLN